jgi:hypothetical protein
MAALIIFYRKYRIGGHVSSSYIVSTFLYAVVLYVLVTMVIAYFYLAIPLSVMVADYYGEPRIAWALLGLAMDIAARLYEKFGP